MNSFNNVDLVPKALSERAARVPIYNDENKFTDNTLHQGLFTLESGVHGQKKMVSEVETITLDGYIGSEYKVDVMKIDVEGHELSVLKGSIETIKRCRPVIFLEVSGKNQSGAGYQTSDPLLFLQEMDYEFRSISTFGKMQPITLKDLKDFQNIVCLPKKLCRNADHAGK